MHERLSHPLDIICFTLSADVHFRYFRIQNLEINSPYQEIAYG